MDPTEIPEIKSAKVNPVTVTFMAFLLIIGFFIGRLSFKLEAQDQDFHEKINALETKIEYYNSRVDRKIENHVEAMHK